MVPLQASLLPSALGPALQPLAPTALLEAAALLVLPALLAPAALGAQLLKCHALLAPFALEAQPHSAPLALMGPPLVCRPAPAVAPALQQQAPTVLWGKPLPLVGPALQEVAALEAAAPSQ